VTGYESGSVEIKAKGGLTARQVALVDVSPEKVVAPILHVGRQWRNAKLPKVKQQPEKRHPRKG